MRSTVGQRLALGVEPNAMNPRSKRAAAMNKRTHEEPELQCLGPRRQLTEFCFTHHGRPG
jgi:hypothetical protein